MTTYGLLVGLEAAQDQEATVERFLEQALPLVRAESEALAWFAVRFRRYHYGIFDVFPDEAARERHVHGPVAQALGERAALFAKAPRFQRVEILAQKLPPELPIEGDRKGLLVRVTPHRGREAELADFMRATRSIVDKEPATTAWFAMRFENGDLGFFDAFTDSRARRKHLLGKAPRELVKRFRLLGGIPRTTLLDVQAETFAA